MNDRSGVELVEGTCCLPEERWLLQHGVTCHKEQVSAVISLPK
jgi:hypothetical protein